jgi:hypothetical protein
MWIGDVYHGFCSAINMSMSENKVDYETSSVMKVKYLVVHRGGVEKL